MSVGPHGPCLGALGHSAVSVGGEAAGGAVPQVRCRKVMVLRAGSGKGAALELGVPEPQGGGVPSCPSGACMRAGQVLGRFLSNLLRAGSGGIQDRSCMEVVFPQVLNDGRGRRGLGEGVPAGAAEPLGELVGVCRALGSLGSQCVCGAAARQALRAAQ